MPPVRVTFTQSLRHPSSARRVNVFNRCIISGDRVKLMCVNQNETPTPLEITKLFFECFFDLDVYQTMEVLSIGKKVLTQLRDWYGLVRWPYRVVHTPDNGSQTFIVKKRLFMIAELEDDPCEDPRLASILREAQALAESNYTPEEAKECPTMDTVVLSKISDVTKRKIDLYNKLPTIPTYPPITSYFPKIPGYPFIPVNLSKGDTPVCDDELAFDVMQDKENIDYQHLHADTVDDLFASFSETTMKEWDKLWSETTQGSA